MINSNYRERAAEDLRMRIKKVTINGEELPFTSTRNGNKVTVITERSPKITQIQSLKILDENNVLILEKSSQTDVRENVTLDFKIEIEVK
ncbi:TPA: hypothetical protein RF372_000456 [Listeria monocytogenes]|uniref:Lin1289 protein n=1 Tax=Listeria innocua serovar 6a (strain ATCC BAA-680 / CLIP 11262) TaxID=272626 RepID=Q92CA1_LISIN|nr:MULTISPECIES: hypothetical protein [Listeria]EAD0692800.1 hypothetical protein [Listeria monocytogenes]EAE5606644.1 hypothetical protein [Listeria monocytogenes]EAG8855230.1 hypothetical protein [Listeria monocytogenes]EAG8945026.1 hypothetical protein [Listeria monocytogenes]EAG8962982.1 hypothetical protein [Listeria monocytogenes]